MCVCVCVCVCVYADALQAVYEEEVREESFFASLPFHYLEASAIMLDVYVCLSLAALRLCRAR